MAEVTIKPIVKIPPVVTICLLSGVDVTFHGLNLAYMAAHPEVYRDADNLPKWLRVEYGLTVEEVTGVLKVWLAESAADASFHKVIKLSPG